MIRLSDLAPPRRRVLVRPGVGAAAVAVGLGLTVPVAAEPAPPPSPPGPNAAAPQAALLGDGPIRLDRAPALSAPAPGPAVKPGNPAAAPTALLPDQPVSAPEPGRTLILDRRRKLLQVLEGGRELRRFPVGVGMPGWETPEGRFRVIEKTADPRWEHPASGKVYPPGPDNPLGSRWIGFYRDCRGRSGFNGQEHLVVKGCVTAGFHGTPNRASIGRAVSHGCVRLFDEHARELFDLVQLGTPVIVLP